MKLYPEGAAFDAMNEAAKRLNLEVSCKLLGIPMKNTDITETERKYHAMMADVKRDADRKADLRPSPTNSGLFKYLSELDTAKTYEDVSKITFAEMEGAIQEYYKKSYTGSWGESYEQILKKLSV